MKNRKPIAVFMANPDFLPNREFTIQEIAEGTGLRKNQVEYEINEMVEDSIINKNVNFQDLRYVYITRGSKFDEYITKKD